MDTLVVTGSAGLIGAEAVRYFAGQGMHAIGIDNDMRRYFFGDEASTAWAAAELKESVPNYTHVGVDIRDRNAIDNVFREHGEDIRLVVHAAAQPSHDWAAREPLTDFGINASGTMNILEATRCHCPGAVFVFTSTNKVYGDRPNSLPLTEAETRWVLPDGHEYSQGITETMPIDCCTHSVFGASKVAADVMVQEYGRYFDMRTVCFRGGCLTGPGHSGAELHGFLAYLMKCCVTGREYRIFGYKGKQVRDNIHSHDLIRAFHEFYKAPRNGEVYNIGGGVYSNVSMLEAIRMCEGIAGKRMNTVYCEQNRVGDHIWWISGLRKFESHYPRWTISHDVPQILTEVFNANLGRAKGNLGSGA